MSNGKKMQKKKNREAKVKNDRHHKETMERESKEIASKGTSIKLYLLSLIVIIAGGFIFYNMR